MALPSTITVGTRGSRLALRQTEIVVAALRWQHPEGQIDVREMRTQGDREATASLAAIGGQGVFVKELEAALLAGEIDVAVHSLKDVPAQLAPGLTLAAFPERRDPRDALVTRDGTTLAGLPPGARIGTSSRRRAVQVLALRPDLENADIRGNVDTRIRKVDAGEYDGAVLALAGLERLGLRDRATEILETDVLLPAVGQAALAVEAREADTELMDLLAAIDDGPTRLACEAERAFLARLGGGCRLPFGALAEVEGDSVRIRAFVSDDSGARTLRGELSVPVAEGAAAGARLAEQLLSEGADELMAAMEAS